MIPPSCLGSAGWFSSARLTLGLSWGHNNEETLLGLGCGGWFHSQLRPQLGWMGLPRADKASLSPHGLNNRVPGPVSLVV